MNISSFDRKRMDSSSQTGLLYMWWQLKTDNTRMRKLTVSSSYWNNIILANCPYLIGTVPILTQEKGRNKSESIMCSYFCKNLPVVMYRKFRNVPIFKDIPPICPYFRVGKYAICLLPVPGQLPAADNSPPEKKKPSYCPPDP